MAVGIYFSASMSPAQYDTVIQTLGQAGALTPKGRSYHAAFLEDDKIAVFDVWDSQADFDAFGATLMPILQEAGVQSPEPFVGSVHNIIIG